MITKPVRVFAATCIVAAGFGYFAALCFFIMSDRIASQKDFISYWAAGQQLMHGANPYDFDAVRSLELATGREDNHPLLMRNPPIAFFLALPLGLLSAKNGLVLWLFTLLACLSISIRLIWLLNGRPDSRFHLFGYVFAPALACLMAGQFGIFLLLGVLLFLYFHQTRPFIAGTALLFCAMKPHLFLPFAIVLFLWIVARKSYQILAGFFSALLASCALSYCFDIHAWSQYLQMMSTGKALDEPVPVLSVVLRFLIDRHAVWIQFLPEIAACCWALWYFWKRRNRWSWMEHGLLLLLVSEMCAPYGWFTDETMALPAILYGVYCAVESRRSLLPLGLIAGIALIELFVGVQIISPYYLWTTPAWLAWFLYATGSNRKSAKLLRGGLAEIADSH